MLASMATRAAPTAAKPRHYTVRDEKGPGSSSEAFDARDRLATELEEHYAATFRIRIETRTPPRRWRVLKVLDVLHADEPQDENDNTPDDVRRDELVEACLELAEGDASEGATEARITGCGERIGSTTFHVPPWKLGDADSSNPRAAGAESMAAMIAATARAFDSLSRNHDRSLKSNLDLMDKLSSTMARQLEITSNTCETLVKTAIESSKHLREAALPTVELRKLDREDKRDQLEHEAEMERLRLDQEMFRSALEVVVDAVTGGGASTVVDRSLCEPARKLASMFGSLDAANTTRARDALGEDAWSALERASKATEVAEFDASFGVAYRLLTTGGKEHAGERIAVLQSVLGVGIVKLHGLIQDHEGRVRVGA